MKRKQKASKPSGVQSGDNSMSKYSNEEISSAITLASIMANDCFDETITQVVNVVNVSDTSGNDSKETINEETKPVSKSQTSPPKTISEESIPKQETIDLEPKQTSLSYTVLPMNAPQTPINVNPYPYGNYYGYYPIDPYGYYSQYYPMISVPSNIPPMSSHQCPYCSMVSPPITPIPTHSSFPMSFNMSAEPQKKMSGPVVVNPIAVNQPQMISTQIPVSSLYPYYQNGPKLTSASVPSSQVESN